MIHRRSPHGLQKDISLDQLGPLEARLVPARHPPSAVLSLPPFDLGFCTAIFVHFCPISSSESPSSTVAQPLGPPRRKNPRSVSVRHRTSRPQGWRRARYSVCSVEKDAAGASPITMTPQRGVGDSRLSNNPTGKMGERGERGVHMSVAFFLEFDPHRLGITQDFLFLRSPGSRAKLIGFNMLVYGV